MKKRILWGIILILLPLLAVGLAAMPDSVRAVISEKEVVSLSFFATLPDGSYPKGLAFGGFLCCVCPALAAGYALSGKRHWLTALMVFSFGGMFFCVLPLVMRMTPPIVPNAAVSFIMGGECLLAFVRKRGDAGKKAETEGTGLRLGGR